jgi:hypothetical protein
VRTRRRHPFGSRRIQAIAAILVVALALAGGVHAYFNSTGNGAGTGSVGTVAAITISPASPTSALYPGGAADVAASIDNPNSVQVHVGSLSLDTARGTNGFAVDSGHADCNVSTLQFATENNGGLGWDVPAKVGAADGTLSLDISAAISMTGNAANACQGASFTVYLKAGP